MESTPEDPTRLAEALRKANSPLAHISSELADTDERTREDLKQPVEVDDIDHLPTLKEMYVERRKWLRIKKVFAVSADLKNSTGLNFGKYVNTSASLYEAASGSTVRILSRFHPGFMDIQGDGVFALFHGERALERAFCAAISVKTFSERHLVPAIEEIFDSRLPDTGYKLGMASGVLAVRKVGVRGTNEPIWAGKPVNWAVKCAQKADRHELVVTEAVFQQLAENDYIRYSCGCKSEGIPGDLWKEIQVEKLGKHSTCSALRSNWCPTHGDGFCSEILNGQRYRDDVRTRARAA